MLHCYACNPDTIHLVTPEEMDGDGFCGGEPVCVCNYIPDPDEYLFSEQTSMPTHHFDIVMD